MRNNTSTRGKGFGVSNAKKTFNEIAKNKSEIPFMQLHDGKMEAIPAIIAAIENSRDLDCRSKIYDTIVYCGFSIAYYTKEELEETKKWVESYDRKVKLKASFVCYKAPELSLLFTNVPD